MPASKGFYTLSGYRRNDPPPISAAMEDYLEMICRLAQERQVVRIGALSEKLHVRPSSASKMVAQLRDAGYLTFERYGYITLTALGRQEGDYLLLRHEVLHDFLRWLNGSDDELEQVEKIEHFIDRRTVASLRRLLVQYAGK